MRRLPWLLLLPWFLLLTCFLATPVIAREIWAGPGWYLWADGGIVIVLDKGPYTSKKECESINQRNITHPPSDDDFDTFLACSYFEKNPKGE